jgi:hypothetical protein
MRLRSRLVTWTMTSMPRSCSSLPTARGSIAMRARGDSVMLSASTESRSSSAVANNLVRSVPFGGVSSPVTTNCLAAIFAARLVDMAAILTCRRAGMQSAGHHFH